MIENVVFTFLGILVAFNVHQSIALKRSETALMALTIESQRLTTFDPADLLNQMKEETMDLVHNMVSNMQTPSIADHLGGVVAQFAQMRMMKMMQAENMLENVAEQMEGQV